MRKIDNSELMNKLGIICFIAMIFAFTSMGISAIRMPERLKGGFVRRIYELDIMVNDARKHSNSLESEISKLEKRVIQLEGQNAKGID